MDESNEKGCTSIRHRGSNSAEVAFLNVPVESVDISYNVRLDKNKGCDKCGQYPRFGYVNQCERDRNASSGAFIVDLPDICPRCSDWAWLFVQKAPAALPKDKGHEYAIDGKENQNTSQWIGVLVKNGTIVFIFDVYKRQDCLHMFPGNIDVLC